MSNVEGPIVGIDLGTTNSVVAAIVDGKPRVLDEDGESILPSVVGIDGQGQLITGVVARNQLAAFPDRTIASNKRKMGTMDPIPLGDQSFTPPEISAMILRRLRDRASRALGRPLNRAVITVPAFFDENQRQATREAGELAGLIDKILPTNRSRKIHGATKTFQAIRIYINNELDELRRGLLAAERIGAGTDPEEGETRGRGNEGDDGRQPVRLLRHGAVQGCAERPEQG